MYGHSRAASVRGDRAAIRSSGALLHSPNPSSGLLIQRLMCFMKKLFCILLLASNFAHGEASLAALTAEQWRQDLAFFANEITTKHRDPFHFISKAEFDRAV